MYPLVITFSRNMDRASVEQAMTIDNKGVITPTWENDYTLSLDISKLLPLWKYTLTIDGSIAKNSQTGQKLDGDGDGVEGGDYKLVFTMAEPDTEAPYVVTTYPVDGTEALYTNRPPIRFEFNEILDFNADLHSDLIVVSDASGKEYKGTLIHDIVAEASVLHFLPTEDLPADKAIAVLYKGGLADLSGNVGAGSAFRFLTEYRAKTASTVVRPLTGPGTFWRPGGSGSSKGLNEEGNTSDTPLGVAPFAGQNSSFCINYSFDPNYSEEYWHIRCHDPKGNDTKVTGHDGILTMWVYGDGSNNETGLYIRNTGDNGLKFRSPGMRVDFRGWNLFVWDMSNDEVGHFTGSAGLSGQWYLDAIYMLHEYTDPDDEEVAQQAWDGRMAYHNMEYTKWDDQAERTAKIEDVKLPDINTGIENITSDSNAPAEYYNLQGTRIAKPSKGALYIVRQGSKVSKVVF